MSRLNQWGGQALPVSASAWHVGRLMLRLSGAEAAVRAARQKLGGEMVDNAAAYWASLREQTHDFFTQDDNRGLWRLSVPSTTPPLVLKGKSLIEWGGAQRWLYSDMDPQAIRDEVAKAGGHTTLFRGGDKGAGVFTPLAPAIAKIHHKLKSAFDPAGIFNPGRMYKDF